MSSYLGVGMVFNKEKRARLTDALAQRQGALGGASASTPSAPIDFAQTAPTPTTPITAIPLATARASPTPTPLERNKSVVAIEFDEDENTAEEHIFKRRRAVAATTSYSTIINCPASFMDYPPSASSPRALLAQAMVRTPLEMSKLHPPPSCLLSFSMPSKASKEGQQRTWTRM